MKKVFRNDSHVQCVFTDDGISIGGSGQEAYFPYGCIDTIHISLLGVFQVGCRARVCSFAVGHADRAEFKELMRSAKEAMKKSSGGEPIITDLSRLPADQRVSSHLPFEEQLAAYKLLFVQGAITKNEYDACKRNLKD